MGLRDGLSLQMPMAGKRLSNCQYLFGDRKVVVGLVG